MSNTQVSENMLPKRSDVFTMLLHNRASGSINPGTLIASTLGVNRPFQQQPSLFYASEQSSISSPWQRDVAPADADASRKRRRVRRSEREKSEADLNTTQLQLKVTELELKLTKLELEAREERLRREEEKIQTARNDGISFFHGANDVNISGSPSFNVYWGRMAPHAWVLLVDITGKEYQMPEFFSGSYSSFKSAISLLFKQDVSEGQIQRRIVWNRQYDLAIDQGHQLLPIDGEHDWSKVESGTKIVMRFLAIETRFRDQWCQCPSVTCRRWNQYISGPISLQCSGCNRRFQVSDRNTCSKEVKRLFPSKPRRHMQNSLSSVRNFHIVCRLPLDAAGSREGASLRTTYGRTIEYSPF
ncbi:hypothetical protein CPB83DRAFT_847105 [Crepidotus variabilis]|uniref:Uncharacterized protein n=1 Tax=Crepidotus variabilis TaxID=179855 RepID=A0A9P6EPP1_9AGAR|nr:hypothetical protein CPB83DRAFT_847105 [Crepidotus variabilis]